MAIDPRRRQKAGEEKAKKMAERRKLAAARPGDLPHASSRARRAEYCTAAWRQPF